MYFLVKFNWLEFLVLGNGVNDMLIPDQLSLLLL